MEKNNNDLELENLETSETLEEQLDRLAKTLSAVEKEAEVEVVSTLKPEEAQEVLQSQILEAESLMSLEDNLILDSLSDQLQEIDAKSEFQTESSSELSESGDSVENSPSEPEPTLSLDQAEIQSAIEALLYISDKPISMDRLHELLGPNFDRALFEEAIQALTQRYTTVHHGIELVEVSGGYQFRTKPGRSLLAKKLVKVQTQRLSAGGMETLAIVAYRQPVMKEDVDKVRGVDSSYFIRHLMERKLIKISGRSELPGRPMLYSTTPEFLEVFGLKDLSVLPSLRELEQMIPGSETPRPEEEDPRVRDMRRMVSEMRDSTESELYYNPDEDERILKEIRERVTSIPTSTPYLEELKAAEALAQQEPQPVDPTGQVEIGLS